MKKLILGLLLIYSVNVLEASSGIAIGYNPATDFTFVYNGKNISPNVLVYLIEEELTNSTCQNDSGRSFILTAIEDPKLMKKIREIIEKDRSDERVDPTTWITPDFTAATHLMKGSATFDYGCAMINLRIEDRKGCIRAQANVSGKGLKNWDEFFELIAEATRSLENQMCMPEFDVKMCMPKFDVQTCPKYYTITTTQKTTTKVKVLEKYRGISKDLKSYQEDKDTYYIYIDAENAKIVQYHVDKKSTRNIHRETYTLNMDSCQYEIEKEDKLIKNMGGRNILKSEDAGWGFEDDTKIYVNLPSSDKELSFTWGKLRENGLYRNSKKYKKKIPQIAKSMMGKVNDMTALFRKESKNNKEIEIFKSLYDYPGTPEHVNCGGKVTMETFLIPPLDGLQDPDIDFKINIRPSTKSEIKIMKKKVK